MPHLETLFGVVLRNPAGWDIPSLLKLRSHKDVVSLDAHCLLSSGRFEQAVLRFRTPKLAQAFELSHVQWDPSRFLNS